MSRFLVLRKCTQHTAMGARCGQQDCSKKAKWIGGLLVRRHVTRGICHVACMCGVTATGSVRWVSPFPARAPCKNA